MVHKISIILQYCRHRITLTYIHQVVLWHCYRVLCVLGGLYSFFYFECELVDRVDNAATLKHSNAPISRCGDCFCIYVLRQDYELFEKIPP